MTITLSNQQAYELAGAFAKAVIERVWDQRAEKLSGKRFVSSAFKEVQSAVRSLKGFERRTFVGAMRGQFADLRTERCMCVRGRDYIDMARARMALEGVAA